MQPQLGAPCADPDLKEFSVAGDFVQLLLRKVEESTAVTIGKPAGKLAPLDFYLPGCGTGLAFTDPADNDRPWFGNWPK